MILKRRGRCVLAAVFVIAAGLLIRLPNSGLPFWLSKYGGSILWGTMVYFLVAAITVARVGRSMVIAVVLAISVECFRLFHTPWLDAFRLTSAGALLFGRVFSIWNLAAYAAGIALGAGAEYRMARNIGIAAELDGGCADFTRF